MASAGERRARAVIRAPNHLGELVLALPALERAAESWTGRPLVQVAAWLVPVLEMSGLAVEPLPLGSRRRVVRAARELRGREVDVGILLTPSFSAALIFALAGLRVRRGTATDGRSWLLTDPVDRGPLLRGHRVAEYLVLVDGGRAERTDGRWGPVPAGAEVGPGLPRDAARGGGGTGGSTSELPRPRLRRLERARRAWRELAEPMGLTPGDGPGAAGDGRPVVGLAPGSHAPARRWPEAKWSRLAGRLAERGTEVVVFGGPGEEELTARVSAGRERVRDLGGRTDLWSLAGGLLACDAVVSNDSGTMHLAAALDRPLVAVWGAGDPRQTAPLSPAARLVGRFDLPCHPCLRQECPRRGPGYEADRARRECLTLVGVDRVVGALQEPTGA